MKNIRVIFVLLALIITGFAWKKYSSSDAVLSSDNTLVVGIAAGYAPFISLNEQGEYEGFDIDVIRAIAEKLNKKLVLKDMGSMAPLLMAIDQKQVDAIIWGLEMTQARLKKFAMINYQGDPSKTYPLIFWKEIPQNLQGLSDLVGKVVCVEPGSAQAGILKKYDGIEIKQVERVDDALLALQYQRADAAFVEPAIAKKFKSKFPEVQIFDVALDAEDQVEGFGIGINKVNQPLMLQMKEAVAALKKEGAIAQFEKRWDLV